VTAAVLLLDRVTTALPEGATPVSVTVPPTVVPPCTLGDVTLTESIVTDVGGAVVVVVVVVLVVVVVVGAVTVHPDSRTFVAGTVPSLRSTVQSAGRVYPDLSILNEPELLLVAICTPSTVIARRATARPSIRSLLPLTSARDTDTAACADPVIAKDTPANVNRVIKPATTERIGNR
jgi:hypothetical protein